VRHRVRRAAHGDAATQATRVKICRR
jgi:hypothetical protein